MFDSYIIKVDCPDEKGLVYKVSEVLYKNGVNIITNKEFVDLENRRFFFRAEVSGEVSTKDIKNELQQKLGSSANIYISKRKRKNIVILCTKEAHALGDILIKHYSQELNADILAVVSNYDILKPLVEKFDIPYHCVSHEGLSRVQHEEKILSILKNYEIDYIVLAKYMRILTPEFVKNYENRIINIHHSFLPAFIGANPYKQAYNRGVKIIGATAHIVNDNLDEGPIISQDIIRVDHTYSWKDMQLAGRNIEKTVLSNALSLAFDDKIFINGNKTVIF